MVLDVQILDLCVCCHAAGDLDAGSCGLPYHLYDTVPLLRSLIPGNTDLPAFSSFTYQNKKLY